MSTEKTDAEKIDSMPEAELKTILKSVLVDCIQGGREHGMTSSEMLDSVCDVFREHGIDKHEPASDAEIDEDDS